MIPEETLRPTAGGGKIWPPGAGCLLALIVCCMSRAIESLVAFFSAAFARRSLEIRGVRSGAECSPLVVPCADTLSATEGGVHEPLFLELVTVSRAGCRAGGGLSTGHAERELSEELEAEVSE